MQSAVVLIGSVSLALLTSLSIYGQQVAEANRVWAVDFVQTKPGELDNYLSYLRENWARVRSEMRRQGSVVSFRVLVDQGTQADANVVLVTEYRDNKAFDSREDLYQAAVARIRAPGAGPTLINGKGARELATILYSRVFVDQPVER
jgi:hypothetical protein